MRYSNDHIEFLTHGFKTLTCAELTAAFNEHFGENKTKTAIHSALTNRGITCGKNDKLKGIYQVVNQEQAEWIKREYNNISRLQLTKAFNLAFPDDQKTVNQLTTFTKNHCISSGLDGRFKPGHKSWNEGTKGLVKPNSGSFRKGDVPANIKPLGHERICTQDGFILIKVEETNPYTGSKTRYKHKHIVIWERSHGPVPSDQVVSFIDGDKLNCALDNLELLTRRELLVLNRLKFKFCPEELKPTVRILAKVKAKTFELMKDRGE